MPKLSVTIITKNEQANIERVLRSVPFADEIVVVDSGSEDATCEIVKKYTKKVIFNEWPGHVKQKQFAVDAASNDWILSLDADEEVSAKLAEQLGRFLKTDPSADAFEVNRQSFYLGRWIKHSGWYPDKRIRLFDRRANRWGGYDPHDRVIPSGTVARIDADILHYPYKDIAHHMSTINSYTSIMASQLYEKGRRASFLDIAFRPLYALVKKLLLKTAFLDGFPGIVIAATSALSVLFKYVKLYELEKNQRKG